MVRILSQDEWMLRCLIAHLNVRSRLEVFVITHQRQNMSGGPEVARVDSKLYDEGGHLPPYVVAEFYVAFPWNKPVEAEESTALLAAE